MNGNTNDANPVVSHDPPVFVKPSHRALTPGQQRILELEDSESFLLRTMPIPEADNTILRWRYRSASQIATRLSIWAAAHHILIAYRMIDGFTARIWRVGAIPQAKA